MLLWSWSSGRFQSGVGSKASKHLIVDFLVKLRKGKRWRKTNKSKEQECSTTTTTTTATTTTTTTTTFFCSPSIRLNVGLGTVPQHFPDKHHPDSRITNIISAQKRMNNLFDIAKGDSWSWKLGMVDANCSFCWYSFCGTSLQLTSTRWV